MAIARASRAKKGATIIKRCGCGRTYTRAQWEALPDKTVYKHEWGEVHDQRPCPCGSHIVIVLDPGEPVPRARQRWYSRATRRPIEVVSLTRGMPSALVTYRAGTRRTTVTTEAFWAQFTKRVPPRPRRR
jgi:hypothetical protein